MLCQCEYGIHSMPACLLCEHLTECCLTLGLDLLYLGTHGALKLRTRINHFSWEFQQISTLKDIVRGDEGPQL